MKEEKLNQKQEILTYLRETYSYKNKVFMLRSKNGNQKPLNEKEVITNTIIYFDNDITKSDFLPILEEFKASKQISDTIIEQAISEKVLNSGKSIQLNWIGPQLPNDAEKELVKNIYITKDSEDKILYFLKFNNRYYLIKDVTSQDVKTAFEISECNNDTYIKFEESLIKWSSDIKEIYNCNPDECETKLNEYIKTNIPTQLITSFRCSITIETKKDGTDVHTFASKVSWGELNENVTFYDVISAIIKKYPTLALPTMTFPKIYGNIGDNAMNIFDISPYMIDTLPELNASWEETKSKYTEDEWSVLCAFVWGVLDKRNTSRQALYVIDKAGYTGKSVFTDVLIRLLGKSATALNLNSTKSQFIYSSIWDKRLVVVGDNKNPQLQRTEVAHNILGGDWVSIEYKGETAFKAKLGAKMIVCSNSDIEIDPTLKHERTRTIILNPKMTKELMLKLHLKDENGELVKDSFGNYKPIGDNQYVEKLMNGIKEFLIHCYNHYKVLCPTNTEIILPDSVCAKLDNIMPEDSITFENICGKFIQITEDDNDTVLLGELHTQFNDIIVTTNLPQHQKSQMRWGNFREYLIKHYNIEFKRSSIKTGKKNIVTGIKFYSEPGQENVNPSNLTNKNIYKDNTKLGEID